MGISGGSGSGATSSAGGMNCSSGVGDQDESSGNMGISKGSGSGATSDTDGMNCSSGVGDQDGASWSLSSSCGHIAVVVAGRRRCAAVRKFGTTEAGSKEKSNTTLVARLSVFSLASVKV